MSRVVVTGLGAVSPLGVGVNHIWKALLDGKSGIVSTSTLCDERYDSIPSKVVGAIPRGSINEGKWDVDDHISRSEARRMSTFVQYAVAATQEALKDASWNPLTQEDKDDTGVVVGSGIGGISEAYDNSVNMHTGGYRKVQPLFVPKLLSNMAAGTISIKYGFAGPNHSVATACATGCHSIGDAYRFIKDGYAKVVVAGASEAAVHPIGLAGFARAKAVAIGSNGDPESESCPFDKERSGFVLSDGSAILILEELEHAKKRNARIYAEVVGYGLAGDAFHITAPSPDGRGAIRSMLSALKGIDPRQVGYVNAHATSTKLGDQIESKAIKSVFQENPDILVSSTKGAIGHLLGAAGAIESVFTILSLYHSLVPITRNLKNPGNPDSSDSQDFDLNYVIGNPVKSTFEYAINNSFGFGGVNTTLAFRRYNE